MTTMTLHDRFWTDEEAAAVAQGLIGAEDYEWEYETPEGTWHVWSGVHETSHRLYRSPKGKYFHGITDDTPPWHTDADACGRAYGPCDWEYFTPWGDERIYRELSPNGPPFEKVVIAEWMIDQHHAGSVADLPEDLREVTRADIDRLYEAGERLKDRQRLLAAQGADA